MVAASDHLHTSLATAFQPGDAIQAAGLLLRPSCPCLGVAKKLGLKGIGGFAVSPSPSDEVLAAFVPEGKGIPGFIGLWKLRELGKSPDSPAPYCRRSFFRARLRPWQSRLAAVLHADTCAGFHALLSHA